MNLSILSPGAWQGWKGWWTKFLYFSPNHLTQLNITQSDREPLRALLNIRLGVGALEKTNSIWTQIRMRLLIGVLVLHCQRTSHFQETSQPAFIRAPILRVCRVTKLSGGLVGRGWRRTEDWVWQLILSVAFWLCKNIGQGSRFSLFWMHSNS